MPLKRGPGSVVGIATGYGLDGPGSNPGGGARFSDPGAHPASCKMGTGSFSGVNSGRGVTLNSHPLLVPWSRKSKAITLLLLRAEHPVQSFTACTRVHFTFTLPCVRSPLKSEILTETLILRYPGISELVACILYHKDGDNSLLRNVTTYLLY